jgi:hypothetical protein
MQNIAILGSAPSSRGLAPFDDPSWDIWSCSPTNAEGALPRVDTVFELHSQEWLLRQPEYKSYNDWLAQQPTVYMLARHPRWPRAAAYPAAEMFKRYKVSFFSSTIAYMLALAIDLKPKMIGLWGIDMSANDEYGRQRIGCHYFIEKAEQAGIKVIAPLESDILHDIPPYGYREVDPMWWKVDTHMKELAARHAQIVAHMIELKKEETILQGAISNAQYISNTYWKGLPNGTS